MRSEQVGVLGQGEGTLLSISLILPHFKGCHSFQSQSYLHSIEMWCSLSFNLEIKKHEAEVGEGVLHGKGVNSAAF